MSTPPIAVPAGLVAAHLKYCGEKDRAWLAALPDLAAGFLDRWRLRLDGPVRHGVVALVLPVRRADGTPAVLKLQHFDEENAAEAATLRAWDGRGAVRLLDHDPDTGTMLLERLRAERDLRTVPDPVAASRIIAGLLARLHRQPPPPGVRHLRDIAPRLLDRVPPAARRLADPDQRRLLQDWAAAVREVAGEPGTALLHWDLHFENVLAAEREPWLAIDPKPLAGDPGFDLMPALHNRWDEAVATGDVASAVRRRFDAMVEVLGLDRERAVAWTLGRVLQNSLWDIEEGRPMSPVQTAIAAAIP